MRRLVLSIFYLFVLHFIWTRYGHEVVNEEKLAVMKENVQSEVASIASEVDWEQLVGDVFHTLVDGITFITDALDESSDQPNSKTNDIASPTLEAPASKVFSVYNIELGDTRAQVESTLGSPKRSAKNEYGLNWDTYHEDYHNFVKVMYNKEDQVVGLYTNQDLISSSLGIKLESPKETVRNALGEPLSQLTKGLKIFLLDEDNSYDTYLKDQSYVTVFYDKHENNSVTAIQLIDEQVEKNKDTLYTNGSVKLEEGFEWQMFDLVNAARVVHGLSLLSWDDHVKETARKHSVDMALNHYFSHNNPDGETPFDRMTDDGITYTLAGENLAYGQTSSIFAHEGLMNSLGHRENILNSGFEYLGVGVAFNDESQPYYTQNYFTN